ncbi:MAG: hypothetical protein K2K56_10645 [Lachnospiraceae bacterium]|nr:hypothetical protein [Lachnospiraceae bacterium]
MKIKFLLKNVYLQCFYHAKFFLLTTVLIAVSYAVLMTAMGAIVPMLGSKIIWNAVSNEKPDKVYKINMWQHYVTGIFDRSSFEEMLSDINEIDGIAGAGVYFMDSVYSRGGRLDTLFVSEELLGMLPLKNTDGEVCDFSVDSTEIPVFAGYGLREKYPAGTVFCVSNVNYKVIGILKKNSFWPLGKTYYGHLITLDNMFVTGIGHSERLRNTSDCGDVLFGLDNFYYFLEEDSDRAKIEQAVIKTAKENNLLINDAYLLEDAYNAEIKELLEEPEYYLMPLLLILISAAVMLLSAVLNVIVRKRNIGVMYTIGYSGEDITRIFTIENAVKILLGFMMALAYYIKIMDPYVSDENCLSMTWYVLPFTALVALLMLYIGHRASLRYIQNINLAEVIGGMGFD